MEMFKFVFLLVLFQFFCNHIQGFEINFRKNITLAQNDYYVLNHSYVKDLSRDTIDYIESIKTNYLITLVTPLFE